MNRVNWSAKYWGRASGLSGSPGPPGSGTTVKLIRIALKNLSEPYCCFKNWSKLVQTCLKLFKIFWNGSHLSKFAQIEMGWKLQLKLIWISLKIIIVLKIGLDLSKLILACLKLFKLGWNGSNLSKLVYLRVEVIFFVLKIIYKLELTYFFGCCCWTVYIFSCFVFNVTIITRAQGLLL